MLAFAAEQKAPRAPPWADYPLLLYRPPGITFDVWEQKRGEEWVKR